MQLQLAVLVYDNTDKDELASSCMDAALQAESSITLPRLALTLPFWISCPTSLQPPSLHQNQKEHRAASLIPKKSNQIGSARQNSVSKLECFSDVQLPHLLEPQRVSMGLSHMGSRNNVRFG